jgi:hypothetical protein
MDLSENNFLDFLNINNFALFYLYVKQAVSGNIKTNIKPGNSTNEKLRD